VSSEEGRKFAKEHNMIFRETSATKGTGVENTFMEVTAKIF
jgi:hypothetical protein